MILMMVKRVIRLLHLTMLMTMVVLTSCSIIDDDNTFVDSDDTIVPKSVEVLIGVNSSKTRTSIADDEMTVNWELSDKIAIWAVGNTDGNIALDGEEFQIKFFYPSASGATFSANVSPFDDGQSYTYRGLYPSTASNDSTTVSYTLPTIQSGLYEGDLDVRVAKPTVNSALTGSDDDNVELSFEALTHLLKITIPEGENLASAPIKKLYLDFPVDVVGAVSYDFTGDSIAPTLINGSSSITVDLGDDRTMDAGDGSSVWVFINPTAEVSGDLVISALGTNNYVTKNYTITLDNHTFTAGHVTPINSRIEEEHPTTTIEFSIGENNLGEDIDSITLTAPSGVIFNESGSNVATFAVDDSNSCSASYITEYYDEAIRLGDISVSFESESAIKSGDAIETSSIVADVVNSFSRDVPYLFEEDFAGISSSSAYTGLTDKDLAGISYWTDGRIYSYWAETSIALRSYYLLGVTYDSYLNLELSGLTGLKADKTVSLYICFYADWKKNKCTKMSLELSYGNSSASVSMSTNSNASQTSITTFRELVLEDCDSESIIEWRTGGSGGSGFSSGYDPVYIDNIKIKIAN